MPCAPPIAPSGGAKLRVAQRIPAGQRRRSRCSPARPRASSPARMIPAGADAVVMQEQCESRKATPSRSGMRRNRASGSAARRRHRGRQHDSCRRHAPARAGAGAGRSVGLATLPVCAAARRGVLHRRRTGDAGRAAEAGRDLQLEPFHACAACCENLGCEITDLGIVPDRCEATRDTLRKAAARARPDHHLAAACRSARKTTSSRRSKRKGGSTMWQIAIKPGKPLAFGEVDRATAAIRRSSSACPAIRYPASSPSCCSCGRSCCGCRAWPTWRRRRIAMRADFAWPKADRRNEFLRAQDATRRRPRPVCQSGFGAC